MTGAGKPVCVVLGGHGFVGSAVVEEATRRGWTVHGVGRNEYESAKGLTCDVLVNANGNSRKYLAAHEPKTEFDASVRSVLQSLHDFKYGLYLHLSSIDVYSNVTDPAQNTEEAPLDIQALSPYGFHKCLAEQCVRHYARPWLIFRMGGFVGAGLWKNSIYDLLKRVPLRVDPDSEYQYMHKRDLARMVLDVYERGQANDVFNICGTGCVSLRSIAALIPGAAVEATKDGRREHYEISTAKLQRLMTVPQSAESVKAFVEAVLAGKESLA